MDLARSTRNVVAGSLVAGAGLTIVSFATMPDFSGDFVSRLEAVASDSLATLSAFAWVVSQLFIAIGVLGVAHLLRDRTPVLAAFGGAFVLLSCFGHAVYGGVQLAMLRMADDTENIATYAALLERLEGGVAIPIMAAGLLGMVLGFLLLGLALWRGGVGPRWVGPAVLVWLLLEFVGSSLSSWAFHASGLLYAVIFGALALVVWRSSPTHWRTEAEAMGSSVPSKAHVPV